LNNSNEYRKQCLRRHYENMDLGKAKFLYNKFGDKSKKMAHVFAKRINAAKGYEAIRMK